MTLLGVWLGVQVKRAIDQRNAVAAVSQLGGRVVYDYQQKPGQLGLFAWDGAPAGPSWLRQAIGDEYFTEVVGVSFIERSLDDDSFQKVVERLARLGSLESLGVDCGALSDRSLRRLGELESLEYLDLYSLKGSAASLDGVANLTALEHLRLSGEGLRGDVCRRFAPLRRLSTLSVYGDWFDDDELAALASLPRIDTLDITSPSITNDGLARLADFPSLTCLLLHCDQVTDDGMQHIGRLTRLQRLSLNAGETLSAGGWRPTDRITGAGVAYFSKLPNLNSLELWGTQVDAAGLASLADLPKLASLRIEPGLSLSRDGIESLKKLRQLRSLETPLDRQSMEELNAALPELSIYSP